MANRSIDRYWRQVHAVQSMTGTSSTIARRAVSALRAGRDWTTAAETKRHPIVVSRTVQELEDEDDTDDGPAYEDLDDWIDTWEDYDGDYEYIDVETNADY